MGRHQRDHCKHDRGCGQGVEHACEGAGGVLDPADPEGTDEAAQVAGAVSWRCRQRPPCRPGPCFMACPGVVTRPCDGGGAERVGRSWDGIALYGRSRLAWPGAFLDAPNGVPSHDTCRRVFMLIGADAFAAGFAARVGLIAGGSGREVVAVGGETIRRSLDRGRGVSNTAYTGCWWRPVLSRLTWVTRCLASHAREAFRSCQDCTAAWVHRRGRQGAWRHPAVERHRERRWKLRGGRAPG